MSRIVLTSDLMSRLRTDLLANEHETYAILFGRSVEVSGQIARVVVREAIAPPSDAYSERTKTRVQLRPEFVAEIAQRARHGHHGIAAGSASSSIINTRWVCIHSGSSFRAMARLA